MKLLLIIISFSKSLTLQKSSTIRFLGIIKPLKSVVFGRVSMLLSSLLATDSSDESDPEMHVTNPSAQTISDSLSHLLSESQSHDNGSGNRDNSPHSA
jgi:hypothetical protein